VRARALCCCRRGAPHCVGCSARSRATSPRSGGHPTGPLHPIAAPGLGRSATSAPGLGAPLPRLRRDWAHPSHICTGAGRTAATSAPGLGPPLPHLHRNWAHPCHIRTGTGLALPRLRQDWMHCCACSYCQSMNFIAATLLLFTRDECPPSLPLCAHGRSRVDQLRRTRSRCQCRPAPPSAAQRRPAPSSAVQRRPAPPSAVQCRPVLSSAVLQPERFALMMRVARPPALHQDSTPSSPIPPVTLAIRPAAHECAV
jgi:hypothetical protein